MGNDTRLKPCPFCGNPAYPYINFGIHSGKVRCLIKCTKCNAKMEYRNEKSAVEAWNRRAENETEK